MNLVRANMINTILIFTILICPSLGENISNPTGQISDHPLHKGWICSSVISAIGLTLNSFVFFIFFQERNSFITSVNAMIMFVFLLCCQYYISHSKNFRIDTGYRLCYCVFTQWETVCFMIDTNPLSRFGIGRDTVKENLKSIKESVLFSTMNFRNVFYW